MTDLKTYTADQISDAWKKYNTIKVLKTLVKGKWTWHIIKSKIPRIQATRAMVVRTADVIDFPVYLDKYYGKE